MHSLLKKRFDTISETEFEYVFHLMYSVYSLPNVILPIVGGVLIYKFGYRLMFLIFGFCVLLGQLLFSLGCSINSIPLMLFGRIIFGLGGESLNTTQYAIIVEWFAVNQIAFALGVCLSFARFGNVLNDIISPRIATVFNYNIEFRCLFSDVVRFCSLCLFIFMHNFIGLYRFQTRHTYSNAGNNHNKLRYF